jgi:hypothetical protein
LAATSSGKSAVRLAAVKPWFASTPIQASGRARRTARTRSASSGSSPVSLSFSCFACAYSTAFADMVPGSFAGTVNVVRSGRGRSRPAMRHTGWPEPLCLEVPQGAVERVACAPRRQEPPQGLAVGALLEVTPHVLDCRRHAFGVVVQVINASGFALAGRAALADARDHHCHVGERVPRDRERGRERDQLPRDRQLHQ